MEATVKEQELDQLLRFEQIKELSSDEQNPREEAVSRSQYRKPLKNSYSDEDSSHSSVDSKKGHTPLPPKPPKGKSALQQAQEEIRWTKEDTTEEDLLSKLEGTGMKDKKIRELANKCKTINLALERERTLRRNLEQQLNATIKANEQAKKQQQDGRHSLEKTTLSRAQGKCAGCQQQEKKIMDFRQKLQAAKSELNKAHRLIAREIGENVDIDQALGEENGWKGRQQKIQKLRGRVKELEQRLAAGGANVSHMSGFTQVSSTTQQQLSSTQRTSTLADNKRKELQNLKVQVEALMNENILLQGKVKSLASRKLTVEAELKDLKSEFEKKKQIFVEKSENDDRFIALLKQQNEKLKKDERVVTKVVYKQGKDTNQDAQLARKQVDTLKRKVKQLMKNNQELLKINQELSQQQLPAPLKEQKVIKTVNQTRQISADRRKQLQEQYLKGNKYLKKLSSQDEQQIYKAWKQSKGKI